MLYATNYNAQYHTDKQRRSLLAKTPCLFTLFYRHARPYLPHWMHRHAPPYLQNSLHRHGPPIPGSALTVLLREAYARVPVHFHDAPSQKVVHCPPNVFYSRATVHNDLLKVVHCPSHVLFSRATVHNDLLKVVHCPPNVLDSRTTMTYAEFIV